VNVYLVADVPEDLVLRGIEQLVQGDGELNDAEVGGEVPATADAVDRFDQEFTYVLAEELQLFVVEPAQVGRGIHAIKYAGHNLCSLLCPHRTTVEP
jgi:hypothetical protein